MARLPDPTPAAPTPAGPALPTLGGPAKRRDAKSAAKVAIPKATGPVRGVPKPLGEPMAPFWFCTHPSRWRVLHGSVVPDYKPLHGTPGANGVNRNRDGSPDMTPAFHAQADQGWTVLDHEIAGPGTSYLQQVEATGGWITLWTTVYPGSRDSRHDGKAEAAWWRKLIDGGTIEGPPLHVLENMLAQYESTLAIYIDRGRAKDGARMARIRGAVEALKLELAKFSEDVA